MKGLVFLLAADIDIQTVFNLHESGQPGTGERWLIKLDTAFGHLRAFPEMAPVFHAAYRRLLLRRSPYGVFYTLEGDRIIVVAVLDLRQDPERIRQRLGIEES